MNSSEFTQFDFTKGFEQDMSSENKSESADSNTCDYDTQYEYNNDNHNSA